MTHKGEKMEGKKLTKQDAIAIGVGVLLDGVIEFLNRIGNTQREYDAEAARLRNEQEQKTRSQP